MMEGPSQPEQLNELVFFPQNIHYGVFVPSTTELKVAVEMGASWVIVGSEMEFLSRSWKAVSQIRRS